MPVRKMTARGTLARKRSLPDACIRRCCEPSFITASLAFRSRFLPGLHGSHVGQIV